MPFGDTGTVKILMAKADSLTEKDVAAALADTELIVTDFAKLKMKKKAKKKSSPKSDQK